MNLITADTINAIIELEFTGRKFQVYSIVSDKALSEPMTFSAAFDSLEKLAYAGGASNGMNIREVM